MTIKNQFKLFILGILIVPTLCMISLPVYHWFTSPERLLLRDVQQVQKMPELAFTDRAWDVIKETLHTIPPEIQFIMVANHSHILLSTIPEFKDRKEIEDSELFDYVKSTSRDFFYQVVSPPLDQNSAKVLLISRVPRDHSRIKHTGPRLSLYLFIFTAAFEVLSI